MCACINILRFFRRKLGHGWTMSPKRCRSGSKMACRVVANKIKNRGETAANWFCTTNNIQLRNRIISRMDESQSAVASETQVTLQNEEPQLLAMDSGNSVVFNSMSVSQKSIAFQAMKSLRPSDSPYDAKSARCLKIPESYKDYCKLNEKQSRVVIQFWNNLKQEVKDQIEAHTKDEERQQVLAQARVPNTSANDLARLLHVRVDPTMQMVWSKSLNSFGNNVRQVVDAEHSHASTERDQCLDPWHAIASFFNDRRVDNSFQPQNVAVLHVLPPVTPREDSCALQIPVKVPRNASGRVVPANGDIPPEMAEELYDINPNERDRPLRSAQWCKQKYSELRSDISRCYANFSRSGYHQNNMHTREGRLEWLINFADKFGLAVQYSLLVLDDMIDQVGKMVSPSIARDSGVPLEEGPCPDTHKRFSSNSDAVYKRQSRQRKKHNLCDSVASGSQVTPPKASNSEATCLPDPDRQSLAEIVRQSTYDATERELQVQALMFFAKGDDDEAKREALQQLKLLAFRRTAPATVHYTQDSSSQSNELDQLSNN